MHRPERRLLGVISNATELLTSRIVSINQLSIERSIFDSVAKNGRILHVHSVWLPLFVDDFRFRLLCWISFQFPVCGQDSKCDCEILDRDWYPLKPQPGEHSVAVRVRIEILRMLCEKLIGSIRVSLFFNFGTPANLVECIQLGKNSVAHRTLLSYGFLL